MTLAVNTSTRPHELEKPRGYQVFDKAPSRMVQRAEIASSSFRKNLDRLLGSCGCCRAWCTLHLTAFPLPQLTNHQHTPLDLRRITRPCRVFIYLSNRRDYLRSHEG